MSLQNVITILQNKFSQSNHQYKYFSAPEGDTLQYPSVTLVAWL